VRGTVFIIVVLLVVVLIGISGQRWLNTQTMEPEQEPTMSVAEIKSATVQIPYDSLFRYNERYVGAIIFFRGEVVQAVSGSEADSYVLRVATKQEFFGSTAIWDKDIIWVNYNGLRVLEKDMVDVWGRVVGLQEYTAVLGNQITVPAVLSLHLEVEGHSFLLAP
jgi:hypothetical protein